MKKTTPSNLEKLFVDNGNGKIIIPAKTIIVGGIKNPNATIFDAESLNNGTQDASTFKTAIAANKISRLKSPNAPRSKINIDEQSSLSVGQQIQNKMAIDVLSDLNVVFVETPTSLLDEMNKDKDAGLIPSSKYLGENTLFTTENLLDLSFEEKKKSITSETEIDVDISQVATNIIGEIFNRVISSSDNNIELFGKKK